MDSNVTWLRITRSAPLANLTAASPGQGTFYVALDAYGYPAGPVAVPDHPDKIDQAETLEMPGGERVLYVGGEVLDIAYHWFPGPFFLLNPSFH